MATARRRKNSMGFVGALVWLFTRLVALAVIAAALWFGWVYLQIMRVASVDQQQTADAIAVFGAAEYAGHPSPVLHARLDHALDLYQHKIAPFIVTLGGGRDLTLPPGVPNSEGEVGMDYLLARGVPANALIAETLSSDTEQSVMRLKEISDDHHFKSVVVVSDATHLFRIRELCRAAGLTVYTSPRLERSHLGRFDQFQRVAHEVLSYTAWRLHLH